MRTACWVLDGIKLSCHTSGGPIFERQPLYLSSSAAIFLTDVSKYKSRGNMNNSLD